jgi:hypothetical protein
MGLMENEEIKVTEDITIDENNQLEVDEIQDYAEEVE